MSRGHSNPLGDLFVVGLGVLLLIGNQLEERIDFGHLCTYQFRPIFEGCVEILVQWRGLLTGPATFHGELAHVLNQVDHTGEIIVELDF